MKFSKFKRDHKIKKVYGYHELQRDQKTIEFGWINLKELDLEQPIVISEVLNAPKEKSATLVSDYQKYFEGLTALTPEEFIKKWAPSPKELDIFWAKLNPNASEGYGNFVLNLAYLIRDHKPFEMFGRTYYVEVIDASGSQDGDQEGKVSQED